MSFKVKIRDTDGRDSLTNVKDLGVLPYANEGETLRYDADLGVWEATSYVSILDDNVNIHNDGVGISADIIVDIDSSGTLEMTSSERMDIASGESIYITSDTGKIDINAHTDIILTSGSHNTRGITVSETNAGFATIPIDTTNFDNNLSSANDTLQKCLETIDEMSMGGGSELVNVETLTANKTLVATDKSVQLLQAGATNNMSYTVNLPTVGLYEGLKFTIKNYTFYDYNGGSITVNGSGISQILYANNDITVIWNGAYWTGVTYNQLGSTTYGYKAQAYNNGTAFGTEADAHSVGTAFGHTARGYTYGAAFGQGASAYSSGASVGSNSQSYSLGAAVGYYSRGQDGGVAVGYQSIGYNYGAAVGYFTNTNDKRYSTALNSYAKCERVNELTTTYTGATTNYSNFCIIGIKEKNYSAALGYEVFLDGSSARLVLVNNSTLNFTLYFTAMDTANGDTHYWKLQGLCKNVAGTVTILNQSVVEDYSDAGLSLAALTLTADDINNSLRVNFAALAGKTIRVGGHFRLHDLRY